MSVLLSKWAAARGVVNQCFKGARGGGANYLASTRFASYKVQNLDDFNERVKNSKVPVIVDFFASWCVPCRKLTPRLELLMDEMEGKVDLAKVDIDEHSELALNYEVGAVPALIVMKGGKVAERLVGLQDMEKLRTFVEKVLYSPDFK